MLGWDRWREIAAEHGLGLIEATLQAAVEAGAIDAQPVRPLAHVLMGALDEAAMLVARADDPEAMRAEVGGTLDSLLSGAQPAGLRPTSRGGLRSRLDRLALSGDPARLLLRVHAHVGELQGGRGVAGLAGDHPRRPRTRPPRRPFRLPSALARRGGPTASKRSSAQVSSRQNSSPPIR